MTGQWLKPFFTAMWVSIVIFLSSSCFGFCQEYDLDQINRLIQQLKGREYSDRITHAKIQLANMKGAAVIPLIAALKDKDSWIPMHAVEILGEVKDERAIGPLIEMLNGPHPPGLHWRAERALIQIGRPAVEPLMITLRDKRSKGRSRAVNALGEIGDPRAIEVLIDALSDQDAHVQISASQALGKMKDPRSVEPLINVLADENLGGCASEALVAIGGPAVGPLVTVVRNHRMPDARARAAKALGEIKDTAAIKALVAAFRDKALTVRFAARDALVSIGSPAVEPLTGIAKDRDREVRRSALSALGKIKDCRVTPVLVRALKDEYDNIRIEAAQALGRTGDPRAVEPLMRAFSDKDYEVAWAAMDALETLGSPAVEYLTGTLERNKDMENRWRAAWVLSNIKDPRADSTLDVLMAGRNLREMDYASVISEGKRGSEVLLVVILSKYGTRKMAEDYLNSGNGTLAKAAHKWAKERGGMVFSSFNKGGGRVKWGKK